uniref:Uncharacterized protein n=1 Tax=Moniliophthora roreri TaxID=221103 RepID=A0A0W0FNG2_MONRR
MASALPLVDRDDNDIMKSLGSLRETSGSVEAVEVEREKAFAAELGTTAFLGGSHYDGSTTDMTDEGSLIEWSTEPFHRSDRQQRNAFSYLLEATLVASRLAVILPYLHFAEMTPLDVVEVVVHYRYGCLPTYENRGPASSVSSNCKLCPVHRPHSESQNPVSIEPSLRIKPTICEFISTIPKLLDSRTCP